MDKQWYVHTMEYFQYSEEMSYQAMKVHGRTLNAFYLVKEGNVYCMILTTQHSGKI